MKHIKPPALALCALLMTVTNAFCNPTDSTLASKTSEFQETLSKLVATDLRDEGATQQVLRAKPLTVANDSKANFRSIDLRSSLPLLASAYIRYVVNSGNRSPFLFAELRQEYCLPTTTSLELVNKTWKRQFIEVTTSTAAPGQRAFMASGVGDTVPKTLVLSVSNGCLTSIQIEQK